jgi:hypothetical protein
MIWHRLGVDGQFSLPQIGGPRDRPVVAIERGKRQHEAIAPQDRQHASLVDLP